MPSRKTRIRKPAPAHTAPDTERHVTLSNRDRDRFLAMLDAQAGPNAALIRAA